MCKIKIPKIFHWCELYLFSMQKTKKKFNSVTSEKKAQIFTSEKRFISYLFQKYKHLTYLFDLPTFAMMTIINMSKFPPFFQQQPAWVSPVLAHWPHLRPQDLASLEIGSLIFPQLQEPTEMRQLCRVWWSQLMRRRPQPGRMVPLSASVQARPVPIITCLPPIQTKLVTTVLTGRAPQPIVVLYWKNLGIVNICVVWFRLLCWFFFLPRQITYTQSFLFPPLKDTKEELLCYSINLLLLFCWVRKKNIPNTSFLQL